MSETATYRTPSGEQHPTIFTGFALPTDHFLPLPHGFIEVCTRIESLAELKIVLYLARHTWGYQEYDRPKCITVDEFMHGRKRKDGSRLDQGTGLSDRGVKNGLALALQHGYLRCRIDAQDKGRLKKYYWLRMTSTLSDGETPAVPGQGNILPPEEHNLPGQGKRLPPDRNILPPEEHNLPGQGNILPPDRKFLPPGRNILPLKQEEDSPRSEKETLETNYKKDSSRKKDPHAREIRSQQAPASAVCFSEKRQKKDSSAWSACALPPMEHPEVHPCLPATTPMQPEDPASSASTRPSPPMDTHGLGEASAPCLTEEQVVQQWETLRGVAYPSPLRQQQVRAARALFQLSLPVPITLEVLTQLYTSGYDAFWQARYGALHLTHLLEREKGSGQMRILRWLTRLQAQSTPVATANDSHPVSSYSRQDPPADQAPGTRTGFERFLPGTHPDDDLDAVLKRLQAEGRLPVLAEY